MHSKDLTRKWNFLGPCGKRVKLLKVPIRHGLTKALGRYKALIMASRKPYLIWSPKASEAFAIASNLKLSGTLFTV